jgi:hypothetical protein
MPSSMRDYKDWECLKPQGACPPPPRLQPLHVAKTLKVFDGVNPTHGVSSESGMAGTPPFEWGVKGDLPLEPFAQVDDKLARG